MSFSQNSLFIIACEGKSEVAYIQELNRLFREMEVSVALHPVGIGTGFFSNVVSTFKRLRKDNPRTPIHIWVDWDIYARNERQAMDAYSSKGKGIPDFSFSRQNFEDFLATHLSPTELSKWLDYCRKSGHLQTPLHSDMYFPRFKECLFPKYIKGELPFELSQTRLETMLANQKETDMPLHCDFADIIKSIMTTVRDNANTP